MTHVLIVNAGFYPEVAAELLKGAQAVLSREKISYDEIVVPGAFEVPAAVRFAAGSDKYDGFVALGCVIRGETTHYDYVCQESARGLMDLSLEGLAIGYGILTVENMKQALKRARADEGDKGGDAATTCLAMIALKAKFGAGQ